MDLHEIVDRLKDISIEHRNSIDILSAHFFFDHRKKAMQNLAHDLHWIFAFIMSVVHKRMEKKCHLDAWFLLTKNGENDWNLLTWMRIFS